jgi:hypothetical protein
LAAVARLAAASTKIVTRMDGFYAYIVDANGHVLRRVDLAFESEDAANDRANS